MVDRATSPERREFKNIATSPIFFKPSSPTKSNKISKEKNGGADNSTNLPTMINKAVSPIKFTDTLEQVQSAKIQEASSVSDNEHVAKRMPNQPLTDDNDLEIERILDSMRLEHNLITPIPLSPSNRREEKSTRCENSDVEKLRDDNKKLESNLESVKKEVDELKRKMQSIDEQFKNFRNKNTAGSDQMANAVSPVHNPSTQIDYDDNVTLDVNDDGNILTSDSDDPELEQRTLTKPTKPVSANIESTENDHSPYKDCESRKKKMKRKLSKLDKLRKRTLLKSKIRRPMGSPKRPIRSRTKLVSPYNRSSPVISKQQEAYDNAVHVWRHLNSKKKVSNQKDTVNASISKEANKSNRDANQTQSKNELSPNKLDDKFNRSHLQKLTNESREGSEAAGADESYGINTLKSAISLPEHPIENGKNNRLDSDKDLFVVRDCSLREQVEMLHRDHPYALTPTDNTVKMPRGAKSPEVRSPVAEPEIQFSSSSTTEINEVNENTLHNENVVCEISHLDSMSPSEDESEDMNMQTRITLNRAPEESKDNSDECDEGTFQEGRGQLEHLSNTEVPNARSSKQLPDSPMIENGTEYQKLSNLVCDSNSKQHAYHSQREGYLSTSTDKTVVFSDTNSCESCDSNTKQPDDSSHEQRILSTSTDYTVVFRDTNNCRSVVQQTEKNISKTDYSEINYDSHTHSGRKRKCQHESEIQSKRPLHNSAVLKISNTEGNQSSAACVEILHGDKPKSVVDIIGKQTDLHNNKQQYNANNNFVNITDDHINVSMKTNVGHILNTLTKKNPTNKKCLMVPVASLRRISDQWSNEFNDLEDYDEPSENRQNENHQDDVISKGIVDDRRNGVLCKAIERYGSERTSSQKSLKKNVLPGIVVINVF